MWLETKWLVTMGLALVQNLSFTSLNKWFVMHLHFSTLSLIFFLLGTSFKSLTKGSATFPVHFIVYAFLSFGLHSPFSQLLSIMFAFGLPFISSFNFVIPVYGIISSLGLLDRWRRRRRWWKIANCWTKSWLQGGREREKKLQGKCHSNKPNCAISSGFAVTYYTNVGLGLAGWLSPI